MNRLLILVLLFPLALLAQEQRPTFRAQADLIVIETQVVNGDGRPMTALSKDDFVAKVGGGVRPVVSATFVQYTDGTEGLSAKRVVETGGAPAMAEPRPEEGRLFVLAVDEFSMSEQQLLPTLQETRAFLSRLQPEDQVALYGFPTGKTNIGFTRDRAAIEKALLPSLGGYLQAQGRFHLTPSELIDLTIPDGEVVSKVKERECSANDQTCGSMIVLEAKALASLYESRAQQSLSGLRSLFQSLASVPGRKSVMLLTGGLLTSDRVGARPDLARFARTAGQDAAKANATLYVLHRDDQMLEQMSVRQGRGAVAPSLRDSSRMAAGLEYLADAANGHLFRVQAGTSEFAFSRVLRETSAYYILGVSTMPKDRDGREHIIEITVSRPGTQVRHRTSIVIDKAK